MKRARYVGTWPFEVLDTWPNKMPAFVVQDSSFKRLACKKTRPCLVFKKFYKIFQILSYIES